MPRTPFDDDADEGKDLGAFKKPHKLSSAVAADEDLVAYYRALEVPLADALARVRGLAPRAAAAGGGGAPSAPAAPPLHSVAALGEEEPLLLVAGAHREARGRHASLASHKKCSRVVESLLRASAAAQLLRFWEGISPYAPYLCCNRYSSHVMQTLLSLAHAYLGGARAVEAAAAGGGEGEGEGEGAAAPPPLPPAEVRAQLLHAACELLEALLPHLLQLLYDESATHVLRSLAALLSGAAPEALLAGEGEGGGRGEEGGGGGGGAKGGKGGARHRRAGLAAGGAGAGAGAGEGDAAAAAAAAAAAYRAALGKKLAARATAALARLAAAVGALGEGAAGCSPEELGALGCDGNASPTLSLLLKAVRAAAPEEGAALARRLVNFSPPGERAGAGEGAPARPHWVYRLLSHAVGSHLVEATVTHGDEALRAALAAAVFSGRLLRLSLHPYANFSVQRLLAVGGGGGEAAVAELTPHVSALVGAGREGVVLQLASAAAGLREGGAQAALLQALAAAAARPAAAGAAAFSPPLPPPPPAPAGTAAGNAPPLLARRSWRAARPAAAGAAASRTRLSQPSVRARSRGASSSARHSSAAATEFRPWQ